MAVVHGISWQLRTAGLALGAHLGLAVAGRVARKAEGKTYKETPADERLFEQASCHFFLLAQLICLSKILAQLCPIDHGKHTPRDFTCFRHCRCWFVTLANLPWFTIWPPRISDQKFTGKAWRASWDWYTNYSNSYVVCDRRWQSYRKKRLRSAPTFDVHERELMWKHVETTQWLNLIELNRS